MSQLERNCKLELLFLYPEPTLIAFPLLERASKRASTWLSSRRFIRSLSNSQDAFSYLNLNQREAQVCMTDLIERELSNASRHALVSLEALSQSLTGNMSCARGLNKPEASRRVKPD